LRLALFKGPNRIGVSPHLRTETDPVSETSVLFFFLVIIRIRTMDKVRNPSNSVCYTPSSEPYRIEMFSVYGGKCLSRKAVHKWVEKHGKCFTDDDEFETEVRKWLRQQSKTYMLRVSTRW
jgi:hypothetical protein